jgi:low temperature requirement protein LtrA
MVKPVIASRNVQKRGGSMAIGRAEALLRKPGQTARPTFLEIFFDLVFVFALTRITQRLVEDLTTERRIILSEAGQTLVLLLATYMVWLATALITDLYDPQRPEIQLLVAAAMFGALLMAVALPEAFGERSLLFAGAYVGIHLVRGLFFVPALRGHPAQLRAIRVFFWFCLSAVPWIAGALVGPEARGVLWTVAIALDYAGFALRQPTPKLGPQPAAGMSVEPEHLSERYRLFFTIALGELILAIGGAYSQGALTTGSTVAFVASFATTALLWRIYIYRAGELLPAAIAAAREPARLATLSAPAHLLMLAGIVAISAGMELVIEHPFGSTDPAWIAFMFGGALLFLAGRAVFEYSVFGRVSRSRVFGIVTLAVLAPAMKLAPPLVIALVPALVLTGVAVSDTIRGRGRPEEPPAPPR